MMMAVRSGHGCLPDGLEWPWIAVGSGLHLLAFALVVLHCLVNRRAATSAVIWMFVAWFFPLLGPFLFLSFGINRVPVKGWHKKQSDDAFRDERRRREDGAMSLVYWRAVHSALATEPETPFARELNATMNTVLPDYPLLGGNHIRPLVTGDEAFPAMLEAIRDARDHIHIQTFIIGHDPVGREFLDALKAKAESGVTVRVLYDRFGSTPARLRGLLGRYRRVPNLRIVGWTQADLVKRQFQINLRNHRKLLVVDGRLAFTGGLNLQVENTSRNRLDPIRDYHFAIRGPIVQELQYSFLSDWYFMTDDDPESLLAVRHFPHLDPEGRALIRVVNGGPSPEARAMNDIFFGAIVTARKQLLAVTPYFVPPEDILQALRSAALRGVDTRLVVPLQNNHLYAGLAGRALYDDLLIAGVRIFQRRPPFIHAKALVVDDTLALIGTANLDARSLRLNYETNLAVFEDEFVNALKRLVIEDMALSNELTRAVWRRRPARQKIAENFCNLLSPIL